MSKLMPSRASRYDPFYRARDPDCEANNLPAHQLGAGGIWGYALICRMREGSPHKQLPRCSLQLRLGFKVALSRHAWQRRTCGFLPTLTSSRTYAISQYSGGKITLILIVPIVKIVVTSSSPAAATATSSSSTTCITVHIFCCHAVHRNPMQVNRRASQSSYFLTSHRAGEQSGFRVLGCSRTEESRQKKRRHTRTSGVAASSLVLC